jgi:hypothetical protein
VASPMLATWKKRGCRWGMDDRVLGMLAHLRPSCVLGSANINSQTTPLALTHKPSSGFHNIQQGSRSGDHDEGPHLEAFVGSQAGGLTRAGGPPDTGGHQPKV